MNNTQFEWDALFTTVIFVVIAGTVIIIARFIITSLANVRLSSYKHEEEMHKFNRIQEERKKLLDFCYDMAKKKESDTKDFIKKTTIKETTTTSDKRDVFEKKEESTSVTNIKEGDNEKDLISLNQIRHECWLIIKKMNDVNDLK